MSQIKNNLLLQGASGTLGKLFVFRVIRGRLVICNRPKKADKLTEHQTKMRDRFLKAVHYARIQMANPESKAEYAKNTNDNKHSAYVVALTDYMKPPITALAQGSPLCFAYFQASA